MTMSRLRRVQRAGVAGIALVALAGAALLGGAPALAASNGPTTLYTSPSNASGSGALYGRALQLTHSGSLNGTILATHEKSVASGSQTFPIYRSTDNGVSFTHISDLSSTYPVLWQPDLYELPQAIGSMPAGTILLAGNFLPSDHSSTHLQLWKSTDHGLTWSFVSTIADGGQGIPNNGETPVWEPFLLVANSKLIAYYSDQRDPSYGQKIVHQTSTNGTSWGSVVNDVAVSPYASRPGMPVVAQIGNGQYMMTFEYGGSPQNFAPYAKLAANPENFGSATANIISTPTLTGEGSPYVVYLPNGGKGTIVVSTGTGGSLFLNRNNGDPNSWTSTTSRIPAGYSRGLIALADNHEIFGISGGPLGNGHNLVQYATDDYGTGAPITGPGGKCVDVYNANPADGTPVQLYGCWANPAQAWTAPGDGTLRALGKCLDIVGNVTTNGALVQLYTCNGVGGQQWVSQSNGTYKNPQSGRCLDDPNGVTTDGTRLRIWDCNTTAAQQFRLG